MENVIVFIAFFQCPMVEKYKYMAELSSCPAWKMYFVTDFPGYNFHLEFAPESDPPFFFFASFTAFFCALFAAAWFCSSFFCFS